ncbi:biotin/lipoyl-binding protein [Pseudoalteromonas sp. SM9913]|uniref:biotin/lipoyl-binding protein n=1 Tax=Pseudoalteromonas sp. (strain SM9913) TaxID=234831 RepID=UPI0002DCC648|nr:biotin/lipoyl-binding protein [Pseudoalteromonas sp. SM9913]
MLFRKEAIAQQSERLTGAITLIQPLSIKLTVLILACVAVTVITFLFTAEYSRKETVRGFLMPNKGVIQSFANQGGMIEQLFVQEGDAVNKGQPLATIIVQQNNSQVCKYNYLMTKLHKTTPYKSKSHLTCRHKNVH